MDSELLRFLGPWRFVRIKTPENRWKRGDFDRSCGRNHGSVRRWNSESGQTLLICEDSMTARDHHGWDNWGRTAELPAGLSRVPADTHRPVPGGFCPAAAGSRRGAG